MKIFRFLFIFFLAALFFPFASVSAETGSAIKADIVRAEPYADAKKTGDLNRGEQLEILGKKGAWLKIKTSKTSGWVRLLSVKRAAGSGGSQISGILDLASGRAGTGKVVATTGVRGLNEEELKSAKYDESEVRKMERYTMTSAQGMQFARSGGLKSVKFDYLPESQKEGEK